MATDYVPTSWVDNTTPVDAARMNHIESALDAAVQMDSELAAAVRLVANKLLTADANQAFKITGDGTISWGPGGAAALDTDLHRYGVGRLSTFSEFDLIRGAGATALGIFRSGDANRRLSIDDQGRLQWSDGTVAPDVNLYRGGVDILGTDDQIQIANRLRAWNGLAGQVVLGGATGAGSAQIFFGSALDVDLTRSAAARIATAGKFDPASLNLQTKAGAPVDGDLLSGAQDGDIVVDTTNSRLYLRIGGVWHYTAINDGAVAGGVDYIGNWNSGTAYAQGSVVLYNGVQYIAVNPSTNQTPPAVAGITGAGAVSLVTVLPSTPFDGQEVIFTDSLTAGTYFWRLRYVAGKATNKWIFAGGSPLKAFVVTTDNVTSTTYAVVATAGPVVTIPVAGDYIVNLGGRIRTNAQTTFMSYDIGATPAVDADATVAEFSSGSTVGNHVFRRVSKTFAAVTLTAKYRTTGGTNTVQDRLLEVTPIAVGG